MTAAPGNSDDFIDLYGRFRVGPSAGQNDRQDRRRRLRGAWLLGSAAVLFAAATLAEVLAAAKVAVVIGGGLAVALAAAALALVAAIVMSAHDAAERASAGEEALRALRHAMGTKPSPSASDQELTAWVRRVEATLQPGEPAPDPPVTS